MQHSVADMIGSEELLSAHTDRMNQSGSNMIPHNLQVMSPDARMASDGVMMIPQPNMTGSLASAVFAPATLAPFQTQAVTSYELKTGSFPMTLNASQTHVTNVSFAEGAHLVTLPADKDLSPEKCKLRSQINNLNHIFVMLSIIVRTRL